MLISEYFFVWFSSTFEFCCLYFLCSHFIHLTCLLVLRDIFFLAQWCVWPLGVRSSGNHYFGYGCWTFSIRFQFWSSYLTMVIGLSGWYWSYCSSITEIKYSTGKFSIYFYQNSIETENTKQTSVCFSKETLLKLVKKAPNPLESWFVSLCWAKMNHTCFIKFKILQSNVVHFKIYKVSKVSKLPSATLENLALTKTATILSVGYSTEKF